MRYVCCGPHTGVGGSCGRPRGNGACNAVYQNYDSLHIKEYYPIVCALHIRDCGVVVVKMRSDESIYFLSLLPSPVPSPSLSLLSLSLSDTSHDPFYKK